MTTEDMGGVEVRTRGGMGVVGEFFFFFYIGGAHLT